MEVKFSLIVTENKTNWRSRPIKLWHLITFLNEGRAQLSSSLARELLHQPGAFPTNDPCYLLGLGTDAWNGLDINPQRLDAPPTVNRLSIFYHDIST